MDAGPQRFVVITGGPGAGKSTLIEALATHGLATMPESGRAVIRDQTATGGEGLPWADRALFAQLMLSADLRAYGAAAEQQGVVLFDRGLPDIAGYLELCGLPVPTQVESAIRRFRYRDAVFVAPPWADIFVKDAERRQDFAEARATHDVMRAVYVRYGYSLVELPPGSVAQRVAFVRAQLPDLHDGLP